MKGSPMMVKGMVLLWIAYTTAAAVAFSSDNSVWNRALLGFCASILPTAVVHYQVFDGENRIVKVAWISLTTGTLVLFGACAYLEHGEAPFAALVGAIIYVFGVTWSHSQIYRNYKKGEETNGKGRGFNSVVWVLSFLYFFGAAGLLFFPSRTTPWHWVLVVTAAASIGSAAYFFRSNERHLPVVIVFLMAATIIFFGAALGTAQIAHDEGYTEHYTGIAAAGTAAASLIVIATHTWNKDEPEEEATQNIQPYVQGLVF